MQTKEYKLFLQRNEDLVKTGELHSLESNVKKQRRVYKCRKASICGRIKYEIIATSAAPGIRLTRKNRIMSKNRERDDKDG